MFDLNQRLTLKKQKEFAEYLIDIQNSIDFKISARGWCYQLEQARVINKDQFNKVEEAINNCRKKGLLPVDFIAEETARAFSGIESPSTYTLERVVEWTLDSVLTGSDNYFTPNWWENEEFYIQVVVEKTDLKTLFEPICRRFHIPIANSKGWSSVSQRAEYARRFKEAEDNGLKCILLYCGDHDPDGLRISETLRKNLEDVSEVIWADGTSGYDPANLEIQRFGLNLDFITNNNLSWIDNLITGSGKDLADTKHPNHNLQYVQDYLQDIGERKCEANAIVVIPSEAREMMREAIEYYLGTDAEERFEQKTKKIREAYNQILANTGIRTAINQAKQRL